MTTPAPGRLKAVWNRATAVSVRAPNFPSRVPGPKPNASESGLEGEHRGTLVSATQHRIAWASICGSQGSKGGGVGHSRHGQGCRGLEGFHRGGGALTVLAIGGSGAEPQRGKSGLDLDDTGPASAGTEEHACRGKTIPGGLIDRTAGGETLGGLEATDGGGSAPRRHRRSDRGHIQRR